MECLAQGKSGVLVGTNKGEISTTALDVVVSSKKPLNLELMNLAGVLAK